MLFPVRNVERNSFVSLDCDHNILRIIIYSNLKDILEFQISY